MVKNFQIISGVISIASVIILLITIYVQINVTQSFAIRYDDRMEYVIDSKNKNVTGLVEVFPLPDPGMLYWEELSPDPNYFTNQHFKKGLDLPFDVVLKKR